MRRRLVVAIAAVAATAVVVLAIPLGVLLQRDDRLQDLLRLQRDTVAATRAVDMPSPRRDTIEVPHSHDILAVYGSNGRRLAGRGPAVAPDVVRNALRTGRPADAIDNGRMVAAAPLVTHERVTGALLAQRTRDDTWYDAYGAWLTLAALAAGIVGAAMVAALLLGRRLARPLEHLASAATRLGRGDFAVRAPRAGVAEIDAVGQALDATAARLGDLVERERAFTADASHQLRTPLAALRLELETAALGAEPPPAIAAALAQVDRLQDTIDTLLAISRDMPRAPEHVDLVEFLRETERQWRGVLAAAGRPLRVNAPARGERTVAASGGVVRQIVDVLIDNARGHGAGAITVGLRDVDAWAAIDVADEGPGFGDDPEAAFRRGASDGDGHGIGLALARSLAHAEGGRLVVSRQGPAPVVTLLLPSRDDDRG